jgi:hypothetical protein
VANDDRRSEDEIDSIPRPKRRFRLGPKKSFCRKRSVFSDAELKGALGLQPAQPAVIRRSTSLVVCYTSQAPQSSRRLTEGGVITTAPEVIAPAETTTRYKRLLEVFSRASTRFKLSVIATIRGGDPSRVKKSL